MFVHNFTNIAVGDQAFFKNVEDFNKRWKQIYAPGDVLDTSAEFYYNGFEVEFLRGKSAQKTMIINDNIVDSVDEVYRMIEKNINDNSNLTPEQRTKILQNYRRVDGNGGINETDGQSYRSLESAMRILNMSGKMTKQIYRAYMNIKTGNWEMADYDVIMQNFKPFTSGTVPVENGQGSPIRTPIQHKTAEMIIFDAGMFKDSPKLRGMYDFMTSNDVDLILFESAVKVGGHSIIDLNGDLSYDTTIGVLENSLSENKFQVVPYEYMVIQQPVPEHFRDSDSLYGTQVRKLIFADFANTDLFNYQVNGKNLNRDELYEVYSENIIEETLEKYGELLGKFKDFESIQTMLLNELEGNTRYSDDLLEAVRAEKVSTQYVDNNGEIVKVIMQRLKLPAFDPVQSTRIQQLFNSIVKTAIHKQKINGGNAINVTQFGISRDKSLQIKFNEDGSVKHIEVYMP